MLFSLAWLDERVSASACQIPCKLNFYKRLIQLCLKTLRHHLTSVEIQPEGKMKANYSTDRSVDVGADGGDVKLVEELFRTEKRDDGQ